MENNWVFIVCLEPSTIFFGVWGFRSFLPHYRGRPPRRSRRGLHGERCFSPHHCVGFLLLRSVPGRSSTVSSNFVTHSSSTHSLFRHAPRIRPYLIVLTGAAGSVWVTRRKDPQSVANGPARRLQNVLSAKNLVNDHLRSAEWLRRLQHGFRASNPCEWTFLASDLFDVCHMDCRRLRCKCPGVRRMGWASVQRFARCKALQLNFGQSLHSCRAQNG